MKETNNTHLFNNSTFDLVQAYCIFDDIVQIMRWEDKPLGGRPPVLNIAEIACIILIQKEYNVVNVKSLYKLIKTCYKSEFKLPSYKSFNESVIKYSKYLLKLVMVILQFIQFTSYLLHNYFGNIFGN